MAESTRIRCDLYVRSGSRYIEVYGFDTEKSFGPSLNEDSNIIIEVPKLRI